ncbi:CoA-disulfide reductase [Virgibacillus necropolis]|uniref:CoA-disulfide reductase n=1 Tax=Virgibacillus necropolis TaxID=163877 RepID=A0A221MGX9_9BACI|nr:CoA-disulfide reductase [Virgibacillus necropolis]ASN06923.1 CoA-disulfide reductase [Virgibacillus necropolis]
MGNKIVIVGGVGGGATVAAQIRRMDSESELILFDKGEHIAFSNCGMPYYIGGIVDEREKLLRDSNDFAEKYKVKLNINSEVVQINREKKEVTYRAEDHEQKESYDTLILAPGAHASVPDLDGLNNEVTFTLHTIPDMDAIHAYIAKNKPKTCAIIGAGFIGLEMVENLHKLGLDCTVIDRSKQVMKLVDPDMATMIQDHLKAKGVNLILNEGMESFTNEGKTIQLSSGKSVEADMTILAVGITPYTKLASEADLQIGETGAIAVNEFMQTNDSSIFALGDAVETADYLTQTQRHVALAWPAHRQAYIIANYLKGKKIPYQGTLGSAIFKVFDLSVAVTGHNGASLDQLGIAYQEVTHEALSHAGYYPGAEKVSIKVMFDANEKIVGAQVIGEDGVDKRLAILATAIKGGITITELAELELAYSPPYSSPKDPINIIGYKAINTKK